MHKILVVTGDGGEAYEALYAVHRLREAGYIPVVAAPSRRRLHLVMHDFEPGWDTYVERPGYGLDAEITFGDVRPADYTAMLLLGGRAPSTFATTKPSSRSPRNLTGPANGSSPSATASRCSLVLVSRKTSA